ncbi:hypothetical protein GCM10023115_52090 [Pontixanthobacter gangjinensis]|uniref:Uncharacterized protein n=1 Tax=Christiangramia aestuarii TaxID=1028746 RepID=A0A7K1LPR3_9FLAO|nr:hypothetical protein [Christiangramia aestuarii]MUP42789.1 hypothetical protein [Christiangramia aestuarii]
MSSAVIITVSLQNSNEDPPKLKLKDSVGDSGENNLNTEVELGANVTWVPDLASGIQSIEIVPKADQTSIFSTEPYNEGNGNYAATIVNEEPVKDGKKIKSEDYSINFYIDGDSEEYCDDPKLSIKT